MEATSINLYELISDIQARKERFRVHPSHVTYRELRERLNFIDEGSLYAMLDAEVANGLIRRVRTINGWAFAVAEE